MRSTSGSVMSLCCALVLLIAGCSAERSAIQQEFDKNEKLRGQGVRVNVVGVENGVVTIEVLGGVSMGAMEAIRQGRSLQNIYDTMDRSVGVLMEAEKSLRRKPEIREVKWQAAKT